VDADGVLKRVGLLANGQSQIDGVAGDDCCGDCEAIVLGDRYGSLFFEGERFSKANGEANTLSQQISL
jgi:hypothetical protein